MSHKKAFAISVSVSVALSAAFFVTLLKLTK